MREVRSNHLEKTLSPLTYTFCKLWYPFDLLAPFFTLITSIAPLIVYLSPSPSVVKRLTYKSSLTFIIRASIFRDLYRVNKDTRVNGLNHVDEVFNSC